MEKGSFKRRRFHHFLVVPKTKGHWPEWRNSYSLPSPTKQPATSLQVARPVVAVAGAAAQQPLEGLPELRAEDRVDDRVQGRVEVAQPQEETDMVE